MRLSLDDVLRIYDHFFLSMHSTSYPLCRMNILTLIHQTADNKRFHPLIFLVLFLTLSLALDPAWLIITVENVSTNTTFCRAFW